jgi:FkbH-like protein
VLIGVASKNDEALVRKALERPDLVVNPQHLFPVEAHWRPKIESIRRTLDTWNIAADSVVFVDDNPLELEQVTAEFPQMECLAFRMDDAQFLLDLRDRFAKRAIREEDVLRTASCAPGRLCASPPQATARRSIDCSRALMPS